MFWKKDKQQQPDPWHDFVVSFNSAVGAAIAAGIDLRSIVASLEAKAEALRVQDAVTRPWAGHSAPFVSGNIDRPLTPRQLEELRREAMGE